jgi:hypothetical protein
MSRLYFHFYCDMARKFLQVEVKCVKEDVIRDHVDFVSSGLHHTKVSKQSLRDVTY